MKQAIIMFPFQQEEKLKISYGLEDRYEFHFCDEDIPDELLKQANVIIGQPGIDQIKKAEKLEWLQCTFAGVDGYLKQFQFPKQVQLTNATGSFGKSISEYMLTMVLSLYKKMNLYEDAQRREVWMDLGQERTLFGKRVLIVGAGDIGTSFAQLLSAFHTTTIGIRRVEREKPDCFEEMYTMDALEEQISKADIVALCLPSTNLTRGIINYEKLHRMKEDAILLNVGRGDTLVTEDLVSILKERPKMQAALDVIKPEPLPQGHPLWQMEQVILTPHISGGSFYHLPETTQNIFSICRENLFHYAAGEKLKNIIDLETGYRKI